MSNIHRAYKRRRRSNVRLIMFAGIIVAVLALGIVGLATQLQGTAPQTGLGAVGSTHEHAFFKVYVNGAAVDFTQEKYLLKSRYAHLHDREPGDIIHIHATGVNLGFFFQTIGISLSSSCLSLDGRQFCNQGVSTLKLFVNDNPNDDFENYFPRDGDRILITYGSENSSVIGSQLDSVKSRPVG